MANFRDHLIAAPLKRWQKRIPESISSISAII